VNIETATPTLRVTPNPRTGPDANQNSRPAASRVVALESAMALHARVNPRMTAVRSFPEAACSSLIRSKTSTLASTAMPMARMNPAMPGRVRVAPTPSSTAYERSPYARRATAARAPRTR
jgi:hypothetical protein